MSEIVNFQIYGVPVVTYGLIGLTTAVLAYATSISEGGEVMSGAMKSLPSVSMPSISLPENPMKSISSMNPFASPTGEEKKSPTENAEPSLEGLNPFPSSEEPKPESEVKGGKKRRRRTPRSKKPSRKNKSGKTRK
jgi:hypothetical protein